MRHIIMGTALAALALAACGGTTPAGTGTGGGGSGTSTTSTASTTATTSTGTGGGGGEPMPWVLGLMSCQVEEPILPPPTDAGAPAIVFQAFAPPTRLVTRVGTAVTRGAGPKGVTGGPYLVVWATGTATGELPAKPRVWETREVTEAEVAWIDQGVGFTDFDLPMALALQDDETLLVGAGLDPHAPAPSADLLCEDAALAADTFGAWGTCPGAACITGPLPASFASYSGLHIAKGH